MTAPAPRRRIYSIDEIVDMMRARTGELVEKVWRLQGRRDGHDFVALNPLRRDRSPGSFRVCLDGNYRGMVKDFASGEVWSPLSFTAALLYKGDTGAALRWARAWLGLSGEDPGAFAQTRKAVEAVRAGEDADSPSAEEVRGKAQRRWLEAREPLLGTPVDGYLAGRGIELARLPYPVRALRYHPHLWNAESNRHWPAMVAGIVGADGKFLSVHRTWLEVQSSGRVTKAPLVEPKKTWGGYKGGAIRLWAGLRVDGETGEVRKGVQLARAPAGTEPDLTEGIEDGLAVVVSDPALRVLVGVSLSNMAALRLPDCVSGLVVWQQNDAPDSPAAAQFARVVESLSGRGLRVRLARPPEGIKDVNEWLQRLLAERQASEGAA